MERKAKIHAIIDAFVAENRLLTSSDKVLVALSGGADSVFLLRYLLEKGYALEAVHCNFHLRGEESMRDERFVRQLCERLGVTLHVHDFDTADYAARHSLSIEMAAREQRYELFESLRRDLACTAIAVAHHRDDNVETLLLNLVRGTGLRGLTGIQPRNGFVVRPLLCISRADILDSLRALQQDFVTDSTNLEANFARNKVRLEILPLLRQINPAADDNIVTTIANLQESAAICDAAIDRDVRACCKTDSQTKELCREHSTAYLQTKDLSFELSTADSHTYYIYKEQLRAAASPLSVLHRLLAPLGFRRSQLLDILRTEQSGKIFASATHEALIDRETIIVRPLQPAKLLDSCDRLSAAVPYHPEDSDTAAHSDDSIPLSASPLFTTEILPASEVQIEKSPTIAYFDTAKICGELRLRHVRTGDRIVPFGMRGTKLVSDLMTDAKLTRFDKANQLAIVDDEKILWLPSLRPSNQTRITPSTTQVLVCKQIPAQNS